MFSSQKQTLFKEQNGLKLQSWSSTWPTWFLKVVKLKLRKNVTKTCCPNDSKSFVTHTGIVVSTP